MKTESFSLKQVYINRVSVALAICIAICLTGIVGMIRRDVLDYRVYLLFSGAIAYLLYAISREPIYATINDDSVSFRHFTLRTSNYLLLDLQEVVYPFILKNERNVSAIRITTKSGRTIILHDSFGALGRELLQRFTSSAGSSCKKSANHFD